MILQRGILVLWVGILFGCRESPKYFTHLSAGSTGIDFTNRLHETDSLNIMTYEYMYNGGGVAVGDVNGDGLPDIFFTANQGEDRLYLNEGKLHFKDVTEPAGVAGRVGWKTGVTMCDVNGDGLLDIYVCYSGAGPASLRGNQLFVNQGVRDGVPVFREMAAAAGLDGGGSNSTQAAFLDYDHDGDLDMVLINHATMFYDPFYNTARLRTQRHPYFSSKFYRNDSHGDTLRFTDVSEGVGLKGGGNNFNLGIAISDVNNDGWPDMYVTNDYEEQDYLYLNQRDGSFKDETRTSLSHTSEYGMGVDVADYNNDGLADIVVLDMLPEDNHRQKMLKGPDDYDRTQQLRSNGYYHQQMRNTLQLNTGVRASGEPVFSEVGQLAGVSNTDWSWSPLVADFDNDGYKDLFISNGYLHDFTNLDFSRFTVAEARAKYGAELPVGDLVGKMASTRINNYLFLNNRDLSFRNVTAEWGLDNPSVSNGAAYADLDNDGDLDLVVNNLDEPASIWENKAVQMNHSHYLTVQLKGRAPNPFGIGAKVMVRADGVTQYQEMYPTRGYQSSMDLRLHFGLGTSNVIDRIEVRWDCGDTSVLENVRVDEILSVEQGAPGAAPAGVAAAGHGLGLFEDVTAATGLGYLHQEDDYVDFKFEKLLPYQLSMQGPFMCQGDVNGDKLEDIFVGGSYGHPGRLYLQARDGRFVPAARQPWAADGMHEDAGSCLFDVDGDGDLDLYVASGDAGPVMISGVQTDRLYINDGKGSFSPAGPGVVPAMTGSRSCVRAADVDGDGDLDLFVGGFVYPGKWPTASASHLLRNDSKGGKVLFTDITKEMDVSLELPGMVTDACWMDVDKDGAADLFVVGQWMAPQLYLNKKGRLVNASVAYGLDRKEGLWTRIFSVDVDGDGDLDFVLGNLAPNTQFRASDAEPMCVYAKDFDGDGHIDPIISYYIQGVEYPFATKDELTQQMPVLKKKYLRYASYADEKPVDILGEQNLAVSKKVFVRELRNCLLINEGSRFVLRPLPMAAQLSAVSGIVAEDVDGDGLGDLVLGGNFYPFRAQLGREDAGKGLVLKGDGKGGFKPLLYHETGLLLEGDVRDMVSVATAGGQRLYIVSRNNDSILVYRKMPKP